MIDLIPVAAATAAPTVLILAIAWPLRGQYGRHADHHDPHRPTRPAAVILAALADEIDTGEIPRDLWGGTDRAAGWTVAAALPGGEG